MLDDKIDFELPIELQVHDNLEDLASIDDIRRMLQKAYNLFLVGKGMREASNYSPITSGAHKMVPFMSSGNCILFTDETDSEFTAHQERLNNITTSWGFSIHTVTGDGNCCFTALAYSLQQQQHIYTSLCKTFFSEKDIDILNSTVEELALKLRHLAVREWLGTLKNIKDFYHMTVLMVVNFHWYFAKLLSFFSLGTFMAHWQVRWLQQLPMP